MKTLSGWKQMFVGQVRIPWFTVSEEIQNLTEPSRIPHDGKSLDIIIGRFHLRLSPEIPLGARKKYLRQNKDWIIRKPQTCSDRQIRGFARIKPGETVTLEVVRDGKRREIEIELRERPTALSTG